MISEPVFAQIGSGSYQPKAIPFERYVDKDRFDHLVATADSIIAHAGIGTIATALEHGKPMIVVPRLPEYGEIVSDHQRHTARRYAELGHVMEATDLSALPELLARLATFRPLPRKANVDGIAARIGDFLRMLRSARSELDQDSA